MQIPSSRSEANALGQKRYFTGKPCSKGHVEPRFTKCGRCISCAALVSLAYRQRNPDRVKLWFAEFRKNNRDAIKSYLAKYYVENKDRYSCDRKAYYLANVDVFRRRASDRYYAEREHIRAKQNAYMKANPDIRRASSALRRARKKAMPGSFTKADIRSLLVTQRNRCCYCLVPIRSGYHVDHILPLALGGTNRKSNIQILCAPCNLRKGASHPLDFARKDGRLL